MSNIETNLTQEELDYLVELVESDSSKDWEKAKNDLKSLFDGVAVFEQRMIYIQKCTQTLLGNLGMLENIADITFINTCKIN